MGTFTLDDVAVQASHCGIWRRWLEANLAYGGIRYGDSLICNHNV